MTKHRISAVVVFTVALLLSIGLSAQQQNFPPGGAGGGISGLTSGFFPRASSSTSIVNSLCDENVTAANTLTCTHTGGLATPSVATGAVPPVITSGTAGLHGMAEGTAPTGLANVDIVYANSSNHCLTVNNNNTDRGCLSTDKVEFCGTTTVCAQTIQSSPLIIFGTVALSSGTPSTATLTGLPFTGVATFVCFGTDQTTAANNLIKFANASPSSTVITGPNTITDVIGYTCIGS